MNSDTTDDSRYPSVLDYYATRESRWGYQLFLANTRHFGYYDKGKTWPFSVSNALRRMEEKLFEQLRLSEGSKVLDAGAGVANVATYMAHKGLYVEAIDLVDRHIEIARANISARHLGDKIRMTKMNYQDLSFEDRVFDGIYTMETFVHATEPDKALAEFYRTLKPGGRLVLFEYDKAQAADMPKAARNAYEQVNKYASMPTFQLFTYGMPKKMLEQAGFIDVEVKDLSANILPMLRFFAIAAYIPYQFIKLFGQQHRFVNAMSAVEFYKYRKYMRYISVTAKKPEKDNA